MTGTPARVEISDIQANSWSRSIMSLASENTRWPALPSALRASCGSLLSNGVSNVPGAIAHTRTPTDERSRAAGKVMLTIAPFEAE